MGEIGKSSSFSKLTNTELKFMRFIWKHPEGVSSEEIYSNFTQSRGTKSTILYNISEKGFVDKVQQGLHHFYRAKIQEVEYDQALLKWELENAFGESSFERLVTAFCGKKRLDEDQKKKIELLLMELQNDSENN